MVVKIRLKKKEEGASGHKSPIQKFSESDLREEIDNERGITLDRKMEVHLAGQSKGMEFLTEKFSQG